MGKYKEYLGLKKGLEEKAGLEKYTAAEIAAKVIFKKEKDR